MEFIELTKAAEELGIDINTLKNKLASSRISINGDKITIDDLHKAKIDLLVEKTYVPSVKSHSKDLVEELHGNLCRDPYFSGIMSRIATSNTAHSFKENHEKDDNTADFENDNITNIIKKNTKYEIISSYSIGKVYKVRKNGIFYVLKILDTSGATNENVTRYLRQIGILKNLRSETIVSVEETAAFHESNKKYLYFVMEYLESQTLESLINKLGQIHLCKALEIASAVASSLVDIYKNNIIHRNVNPTNILITKKGDLKLAGFGLAKSLDSQSNITIAGSTVGNLYYIALEQAVGSVETDHHADIYGLGATFYHMLSGKAPYHELSDQDILHFKEHGTPPTPIYYILDSKKRKIKIPDSIQDFLNKTMARNPEDRYQTPQEVKKTIDNLLIDIER